MDLMLQKKPLGSVKDRIGAIPEYSKFRASAVWRLFPVDVFPAHARPTVRSESWRLM